MASRCMRRRVPLLAVIILPIMPAVQATVRAAEATAAEWRLAWEDRFERGEPGSDWDFVLGEGRIVDGRLQISCGRDHVIAMPRRDFADDVRVEFEAEADAALPPCDIACGLASSDFFGYGYLLQFGAQLNQVNQVYTPSTGIMLRQRDDHPPFHIEYHKVYRCVASKTGGRITYEVNDTPLLGITDPDPLGGPGFGRVCFVTWSRIYLDNIRIYERNRPAPGGPRLVHRPALRDLGFRWHDRKLSYSGTEPLNERVRAGIEAYNARHCAEARDILAAIDPPTPQSTAALAYVLGDLALAESESDQQKLKVLAQAVARSRPNDQAAADLATLADWFSGVTPYRRNKCNAERVFQAGEVNNPLYYKSNLYRARYHLAWAQESGLPRQSREAVALLESLKRLWPDHAGVAALTGGKQPWGEELIRRDPGAPDWARLLQEGLARSQAVMGWWFTQRQAADGRLGGGWGDDCELLRSWGMPAAITSAGETSVAGIQRLADGIWEYAVSPQGYPGMSDIEHAAEPAADSHPLMMFLRYGDPLYVERNLKTAKFLRDVAMGVNERGGLQFKSYIFGSDGVDMHPICLGQNMYHSRAMRHFVWLAWYGIPEAREILLRWADNIRDVAMSEIGPKPAGYMPYTIFWPAGSIYPPENRFWLDPKAHGYGLAPDKLWKLYFPLFSAYSLSGDRRFLEPFDRMMDYARMSPGREEVDMSLPRDDPRNLLADFSREPCPDLATLYRWSTGSPAYDEFGLSEPMLLQLNHDTAAYARRLEPIIGEFRLNWAAKTSEVLQTDRFDLPADFLLFGAYTGAVTSLIEDGLIPTVAVTWNTPNTLFAALVMGASRDRLGILAYNFDAQPMRIGCRPWQLAPGRYLLSQGSLQGERLRPVAWDRPRPVTHLRRGEPIDVVLPPGKVSVLELRLQEAIARPERLPDLAAGGGDVRVSGRDLHVTVHNIGSAPAGPFSVAAELQRDGKWVVAAQVHVEGLAAIARLEPSTVQVVLADAAPAGGVPGRVSIDPEAKLDELCKLNNQVPVPPPGRITSSGSGGSAGSPLHATLIRDGAFATLTHQLQRTDRVGYRFHEHTPIAWGAVPASPAAAGIPPGEVAEAERAFSGRTGVLIRDQAVAGASWIPQQWTFYLAPVADGIDLLWVVEPKEQGLPEYYGVQQCFRMSGRSNEEWRKPIAEAPTFSEYDLWSLEADKPVRTSLTHVIRNDGWTSLPAGPEPIGARTPLGCRVDSLITGGRLETMPKVGPYGATMIEPIDAGLITRASLDGAWVCGLHWDRTSHVTDHHPADCLHSIVNIGGIPAGSKRAIRGKIYWFKGGLADLRAHWNSDWGTPRADRPR